MKRRDFLHNLAHVAAVPMVYNSLGFDNAGFQDLLYNSDSTKKLILIRLDGGNDGLNTLIPLNKYSELSNVRPHVVLPENKIIDLGEKDLGLHPELGRFKSLFDEKRLKIIQNVGYNTPDFSHFRSMDIWQTASDSNQYLTSGWIGRYMEDLHPLYPEQYPTSDFPHPLAVELGQSSLLTTGVKSVTSFTSNQPWNFREIIGDFDNTYPEDNIGKKLKFIQIITRQSNIYGEVLKSSYEKGNNFDNYPNSDLGKQLQVASSLIKGGLESKIYLANLGGFDTHDNQVSLSDTTKGEHANLMRDLNNSIGALFDDLDLNSKSEDVLVMTFSEFGRTIVSNGSNGTDHGTAAPLFVFGNKVDFNVSGENPEIPQNAIWEDNLETEFDFRQVYYSLIKQWLGGNENTAENVLFNKFDQIPIIQGKYIDTDGDGVSDDRDLCNSTPLGAMVNTDGCEIFSLPLENYSIQTNGVSCSGKTNGVITINVQNSDHIYNLSIPETEDTFNLNSENNHQLIINELEIGTYTLNFTIEGQEGYLQTFEIGITEPPALSAKSSVNQKGKTMMVNVSGSDIYYAEVNGERRRYKINTLNLQLRSGMNTIKISTPQECQGIHVEQVFISEQVRHYPNPVQNKLNLVIPGQDTSTTVSVFDKSGNLLHRYQESIPFSRIVLINTSKFSSDIYVVKVNGQTVDQTFKMMKR
ncbi:DUF1501 domain-containing protein [Flavobacteriaceae bacterium]|nr:DUF1501 domain-containing protein [Flavobacteriaceae bacterium]